MSAFLLPLQAGFRPVHGKIEVMFFLKIQYRIADNDEQSLDVPILMVVRLSIVKLCLGGVSGPRRLLT